MEELYEIIEEVVDFDEELADINIEESQFAEEYEKGIDDAQGVEE